MFQLDTTTLQLFFSCCRASPPVADSNSRRIEVNYPGWHLGSQQSSRTPRYITRAATRAAAATTSSLSKHILGRRPILRTVIAGITRTGRLAYPLILYPDLSCGQIEGPFLPRLPFDSGYFQRLEGCSRRTATPTGASLGHLPPVGYV